METQDCNSSDIRPEAEVGSANATKGASCLRNHIDRCKKYPTNIELAQRKLALQARFSVDGSKLMMEGKGASVVGFYCWSYSSCWFSLQACCFVIAAANPIIGTARTSLIVTIGPSLWHRGETASTILFGQREDNMCASEELAKVEKLLENEMSLRRATEVEVNNLKSKRV
ncbi:hypothetical protein Ancab_038048 [Ancistrocladus abbreviatus]